MSFRTLKRIVEHLDILSIPIEILKNNTSEVINSNNGVLPSPSLNNVFSDTNNDLKSKSFTKKNLRHWNFVGEKYTKYPKHLGIINLINLQIIESFFDDELFNIYFIFIISPMEEVNDTSCLS